MVSDTRGEFDAQAAQYDDLIQRLIPNYQTQKEVLLELITIDRNAAFRFIDLGAGTGALSFGVLNAFCRSRGVVFDLADNMIAACRQKLAGFGDRVTYQRGDFSSDNFGSGYDLVMSGFAVHHLDDPAKRELFRRISEAMNPGGILLISDIVNGANNRLTDIYETRWRAFMRANGEDDAMWYEKFRVADFPSSVEDQTAWLVEAGFETVGCHWRHLNFAVFGGCVPAGKTGR